METFVFASIREYLCCPFQHPVQQPRAHPNLWPLMVIYFSPMRGLKTSAGYLNRCSMGLTDFYSSQSFGRVQILDCHLNAASMSGGIWLHKQVPACASLPPDRVELQQYRPSPRRDPHPTERHSHLYRCANPQPQVASEAVAER